MLKIVDSRQAITRPMLTQMSEDVWHHMLSLDHHYNDVIMGMMASQITRLIIVYSTVYSSSDQRKHQSSASLAFVRGIHRGPVNSSHKWPVTRKMLPFEDIIMAMSQQELYHLIPKYSNSVIYIFYLFKCKFSILWVFMIRLYLSHLLWGPIKLQLPAYIKIHDFW